MNLKEQLEAKKEELKSLDLTTEEGIIHAIVKKY